MNLGTTIDSTPCKQCKERTPFCHGSCEKYLEWRDMYVKEQERLRELKRQKGIGYIRERVRRRK